MPICQWSKSILTAPHPTYTWTFFQLKRKFFFVWNIMISFNQKYIDLKKSIVFCKYIVFIILQNEPIQLGNHQFACPFCTKIMKLKADVKRHIRTHTGEKPYACKFCPYRSSQKGTLQYHVQHIHGDFSNWKEINICCLLVF